ncbi:MAG: hypothetical protein OXE42_03715 [Gammaproteobacteria bacterium]|nr:hypothetical protein [Gammaproteobacteria bacterium]
MFRATQRRQDKAQPAENGAPFPARRALRSTASRPAEHVNITWKEY